MRFMLDFPSFIRYHLAVGCKGKASHPSARFKTLARRAHLLFGGYMTSLLSYFSRLERVLWCSSVALIPISFTAFDRENYITLAASLIGVTSLIFSAKGNPAGQVLMTVFRSYSACFTAL